MKWDVFLPDLILILGILVIFVLELFLGKRHFKFLTLLGATVPVLSFFSLFWVPVNVPIFMESYSVSSVSLVGKAVIYLLTSLALFASYDYFLRKTSPYGELVYLMLSATLGLSLLLSSSTLPVLFLSLELASISMYIMVALLKGDYLSKEASFKYLVIGSIGTASFGMGSVFYYGATGSMRITVPVSENSLVLLAVLLLLSALALKVSAVPFHFWTPDAYEGAPAPVTGYLSTVPKVALYFLLVQLATHLSHVKVWMVMVSVIALLSMFYANLVAYVQKSVKRLLAYSSVAHAGYFLMGVVLSDKILASALLFYASVYAFATLGAFVVLSVLEKKEGFSHHVADFNGLWREKPVLASLLALFLFALIGIPPMALFVGKLALFMGLWGKGFSLLALAFAVASVISAGYYLRVIVHMFMEEGGRKSLPHVSAGEAFTLLVCGLSVLYLGLFPQTLFSFIQRALW
ncbi:proton-translocating NADH-quinone oxidoreductase, chain N [Thermocrinis albus DSM 14484]|uniref:NADH-quinone oxidoreductase subunit N n=1 Tax=Thermocrinis albus (strain DSM 14484 / JCM 11386 / HI 11/12) TaxID=638303 RepID=D3SM71_THEAH|nr:NADH-quinone oxidoreductase subunit N [Thermocrinis albus]ADC89851.1 proton-translocating NADH-quinone oxidoreductase, chain N [Thermocrinis albus DSM 14484]